MAAHAHVSGRNVVARNVQMFGGVDGNGRNGSEPTAGMTATMMATASDDKSNETSHLRLEIARMREHLVFLAGQPGELEEEVARLRHLAAARDAQIHSLRLQLRETSRGPTLDIQNQVGHLKKKVYEKDLETALLYQQIALYRDGLTIPSGIPQSIEVKQRLLTKRQQLQQLEVQLKQLKSGPREVDPSILSEHDVTRLQQLVARRDNELKQLYQQVVELSEVIATRDRQLATKASHENELGRVINDKHILVMESQSHVEVLQAECRHLRGLLDSRATSSVSSKSVPSVAGLSSSTPPTNKRATNQNATNHNGAQTIHTNDEHEHVTMTRAQWQQQLERHHHQWHQLQAHERDVEAKRMAEEIVTRKRHVTTLTRLASTIRGEVTALMGIVEAKKKGDEPDIELLVGSAAPTKDNGRSREGHTPDAVTPHEIHDTNVMLDTIRADLRAIRSTIADAYAHTIGDQCTLQ